MVLLLKFRIKDGFPFNVTSLQEYSTNDFLNLEIITSCHYIQHITLHQSLVHLAITSLKYKDYKNFYQLLWLLSGDVNPNLWLVQISPTVNVNNWKPLNKKGLHFFLVDINGLLPKIDELKCITNGTKATIIEISKLTFQGIIFLMWQK